MDQRVMMKRLVGAASAVLLALTYFAGVSGQVPSQPGQWMTTGSVTAARQGAASVLLEDGRVLTLGGRTADGAIPTAETYRAGSWSEVDNPVQRWGHTATNLSLRHPLAAPPPENAPRGVVIIGGENSAGLLSDIDILDPSTNTLKVLGSLPTPLKGHAATLLVDGRVLVAGGFDGENVQDSVHIVDPATGLLVPAQHPATGDPIKLSRARAGLTATTLLDGRVLLTGGNDGTDDQRVVEIINLTTGAVTVSAMTSARRDHQAFLLPNNNTVLLVGGADSNGALASAEVFVPWLGQFRATGSLDVARHRASGAALAGERYGIAAQLRPSVVIAGGEGTASEIGATTLASAEVYRGFATVMTEKDDYLPGQTVTMSGTGWQPGETVTLSLRELPAEHGTRYFTAVADESGNISNTDLVLEDHDLGVRFFLTAAGGTSKVEARTTFTDGNATIAGVVTDATITSGPAGIGGAKITCTSGCNELKEVVTAADGTYSFMVNFNGNSAEITLTASKDGYTSQTASVSASNSARDAFIRNFSLTPSISVVPTTIAVSAASASYGDSEVALSATVSASKQVDVGTVTFTVQKNDGTGIGSATTSSTVSNGAASVNYTIPGGTAAGTYDLVATYNPGSGFKTSSGTGKLTIKPRAITVTADAQSKSYGEADPALTYKATSGALHGSDSFTGALTRAAGETVGEYAIEQGTLTAGTNYDLEFIGAKLTIKPRAITVTADAQSKSYGEADPALTYKVTSGALHGSDSFTGALTRAAGETVGEYAIEQGTLTAGTNYNLEFTGAKLTIKPRAITVTADAQSKTYGEADPALTYKVTSGALHGSDSFTGALTRAAGVAVGDYAITQGTLTAGDNYTLTFVGAELTITPRAITVTPDAKSKTYGNADPALTFSVPPGSVVSGDSFSGALARVPGESVGTYVITQGSLSLSTNYTLTFGSASLTISPRPVAVTADDQVKVLGSNDPALSYRITAGVLVAGDAFSGELTRDSGEDVGSYGIKRGTLTLGSNYDLTVAAGTFRIVYAPAGASCLGGPGRTILQPVNPDGSSVFKQGSTVPAKFRVCDAAGNSVGTAGVVVKFQQILSSSGTVTVVNETVDSTTPDTSFRWSAVDQQWIFNMSTRSLKAGQTYTFRISLADGTAIDLRYGLR